MKYRARQRRTAGGDCAAAHFSHPVPGDPGRHASANQRSRPEERLEGARQETSSRPHRKRATSRGDGAPSNPGEPSSSKSLRSDLKGQGRRTKKVSRSETSLTTPQLPKTCNGYPVSASRSGNSTCYNDQARSRHSDPGEGSSHSAVLELNFPLQQDQDWHETHVINNRNAYDPPMAAPSLRFETNLPPDRLVELVIRKNDEEEPEPVKAVIDSECRNSVLSLEVAMALDVTTAPMNPGESGTPVYSNWAGQILLLHYATELHIEIEAHGIHTKATKVLIAVLPRGIDFIIGTRQARILKLSPTPHRTQRQSLARNLSPRPYTGPEAAASSAQQASQASKPGTSQVMDGRYHLSSYGTLPALSPGTTLPSAPEFPHTYSQPTLGPTMLPPTSGFELQTASPQYNLSSAEGHIPTVNLTENCNLGLSVSQEYGKELQEMNVQVSPLWIGDSSTVFGSYDAMLGSSNNVI